MKEKKKIVSRSRNEEFIITNINGLWIYSPFEKNNPFLIDFKLVFIGLPKLLRQWSCFLIAPSPRLSTCASVVPAPNNSRYIPFISRKSTAIGIETRSSIESQEKLDQRTSLRGLDPIVWLTNRVSHSPSENSASDYKKQRTSNNPRKLSRSPTRRHVRCWCNGDRDTELVRVDKNEGGDGCIPLQKPG